MFTGIIEDLGEVYRWQKRGGAGVLTLTSKLPMKEMKLGASIAVNGACLTIVEKTGDRFTVDVSPETLQRTNFRALRRGDIVNLERPLRLSDRLGGHLELQLVPKGSVAVDGISLTVNECKKGRFTVAVIPFTLKHTNLRDRRVGDKVNIETDLIGKYVQRLLPLKPCPSPTLKKS